MEPSDTVFIIRNESVILPEGASDALFWAELLAAEVAGLKVWEPRPEVATYDIPSVRVSGRDIDNDDVSWNVSFPVGKAFMLDGGDYGHGSWPGYIDLEEYRIDDYFKAWEVTMPWDVREHEGQWCVFKEGEETPIEGGCHPTEDEANEHRQALYANTEEGKATHEEEQPEEAPAGDEEEQPRPEAGTLRVPEEEEKKPARSTKAPTLLTTFEAEIHRQFTLMADSFYANGNLTRDERIALSGAIGEALAAFTANLERALPPEVLNRSPWADVLPAHPVPAVMKDAGLELLRDMWMASKGLPGPTVERAIDMKATHVLPDELVIKSLGRNRIGGYLCLWGNENAKDLTGEWFAPDTAELTSVFEAVGAVPALYHHAGDKLIKSMVPAILDVMEKDDVGLWVEAQIKKRQEYNKFIAPLVEQKLLGWSSGTLPRARQVDKATGKILRWPIVEASMTPTPAEWRMAVQWPVANLKALYGEAGLALKGFEVELERSTLEQELELLKFLAL